MPALSSKSLEELQQRLGYSFNNSELLIQALTHKSYAGEHGLKSYETLEFLGDSLINFFVVDILLSEFTSASEGELAMMKSYFVSEDYLHELAEELSLDMYILYGGRRKNSYVSSSLMADTFEALWAAVYLDCGRSADFVKELFGKLYRERLVSAVKNKDYKRDYKTLLQEETQKRWKERPIYRVVSVEGPHHNRVFEVECNIREFRATAKGRSKKSAQQLAAKKVLELILSSES
ncbi:ribonuclease III [Hydrogenobacter sp. T-2]|uniref:ribonuclease III n=1 Tax=Pampinifervens diazotrophicum TaxID=1632018 RepID=UPI002B262F9D|nr:ribonuclease III [Hydrogenobacter sp. T-2]WPM31246.1 ribonuclease III [Hydrogenobacter sp. T-2]